VQACLLKIASPEIWTTDLKNISHSSLLVHRNIVHSLQIRQELLKYMWQSTRADVAEIVGYYMFPAAAVKKIWAIAYNFADVTFREHIEVRVDTSVGIENHIFRNVHAHYRIFQAAVRAPELRVPCSAEFFHGWLIPQAVLPSSHILESFV